MEVGPRLSYGHAGNLEAQLELLFMPLCGHSMHETRTPEQVAFRSLAAISALRRSVVLNTRARDTLGAIDDASNKAWRVGNSLSIAEPL
jgi:hypothetical protein